MMVGGGVLLTDWDFLRPKIPLIEVAFDFWVGEGVGDDEFGFLEDSSSEL